MTHLGQDLAKLAVTRRRTKIVATLGPATASDDAVAQLVAAGVDVFRVNFSHGTHADHAAAIARVRKAAAAAGKHVGVLGDLSGPKIRVGTFPGGPVVLAHGARLTVTTREVPGTATLVPSQYAALAKDVRAGDRILLDDGKLELRVIASDGNTEVACEVVHGGVLSDKKGMNLPGVAVSAPALGPKDERDARFAVEQGVDFLALSFVRAASDVVQLRSLLVQLGEPSLPIVAKIEKPEALAVIDAILDVTDAIMVARGDLGVEMPAEQVPILQAELIRVAIAKNRPVIVATQMLESMIADARPTRAEMGDVASAAMQHADAVMLSGETAVGKHATAAVTTMDRVLRLVEGYQLDRKERGHVPALLEAAFAGPARLASDEALSRATSLLSADLGVCAIAVPTKTGRTARLVSAERPAAPILALTATDALARRLALSWGLTADAVGAAALDPPRDAAVASIRARGLAGPGKRVLLVWDAGTERTEPTVTIVRT